MADTVGPLTQDHLRQIQDGLHFIGLAETQIELAQRAGLDVSDQKAKLVDAKAKLLQIKQVYFPNQ